MVDVFGNAGTVPPAHIFNDVPKLNVGVMFGATVTVKVVGNAHWPAVGVNVYVPLAVLLTVDGLHVPFTPLSDAVGNVGTAAPEQIFKDVPKLNVGVTLGVTVTVKVVGKAH